MCDSDEKRIYQFTKKFGKNIENQPNLKKKNFKYSAVFVTILLQVHSKKPYTLAAKLKNS